MERKQDFTAFCEVAQQFAACMNDYLYVYDIMNDTYFITESATERFDLPGSMFHNVLDSLKRVIYPDDYPMLVADIRQLLAAEKAEHDMQ
ncbi:MAG: hypothetical protein K2K19_08655 [Acetatifactor sp.]|nr:hypothetical protein [Acetatifactor sp.]